MCCSSLAMGLIPCNLQSACLPGGHPFTMECTRRCPEVENGLPGDVRQALRGTTLGSSRLQEVPSLPLLPLQGPLKSFLDDNCSMFRWGDTGPSTLKETHSVVLSLSLSFSLSLSLSLCLSISAAQWLDPLAQGPCRVSLAPGSCTSPSSGQQLDRFLGPGTRKLPGPHPRSRASTGRRSCPRPACGVGYLGQFLKALKAPRRSLGVPSPGKDG